MKRFSYLMVGFAAFLLSSCSNDDLFNSTGESGIANLTVDVELPVMHSRAFGDGTSATYLQYAIYEIEDDGSLKMVVQPEETQMENKAKDINVQLLSKKNYKLVFWASAESKDATGSDKKTPYSVEFGESTVTMTCDQGSFYPETSWWKINNDNLDAFFATKDLYLKGDITETIELKRATAQINFGTNDYDKAKELGLYENIEDLNVEVRIENVYTKLDLISGEVSEPINKKFYFGDLDQNFINQKFPVEGDYKYLAVVYALVAPEQELVTVSYGYDTSHVTLSADDFKVTNVPVKRNYRTNIFGSLLTDALNIQVVISDSFGGDSYDQNLDNLIANGVFYDKETKTYTITSAEGLAWIRNYTNSLPNQSTGMNGYTVKLGADIDLNNESWTPMNNNSGVFDGNNFTVSNLKVDLTTTNTDASAGLFSTGRGTVKNLTIDGADVKGNYKVGAVAGDGLCATFENVHVKNAKVTSIPWKKNGSDYDDGNNCGGIVGYLSCEANGGLTGCSVENSTIRAYRKVGGLIGYAGAYDSNPITIARNTLKKVTVVADMMTNAYSNTTPDCGQVIGGKDANVTIGENSITDVISGVTRIDAEGNFEINTFSDLQAIASLGATAYRGKTIKLQNDIDLEGVEFSQVTFWDSNKPTFDGGNHTIKNVTIPQGQNGLFYRCQMNIKNLKIDGFFINSDKIDSGNYVGLVNNLYGDLENVEMTNVKIITKGTSSALVGIHNGGNMTGCKVSNAVISGTNRVGTLVGRVNEGTNRSYTNCTVTSIELTCTNANYRGLLVGNINTTGISFQGCDMINCTINGEPSKVGIAYLDSATGGITWNGTSIANGKIDWDSIWNQ